MLVFNKSSGICFNVLFILINCPSEIISDSIFFFVLLTIIVFNVIPLFLINFYETRLEEIKQSYENQLNEQKKQVEYFKNLYEEEKSERIRANAQYQTYLLGTAEDNKRHWWQFWNKTNKERDN